MTTVKCKLLAALRSKGRKIDWEHLVTTMSHWAHDTTLFMNGALAYVLSEYPDHIPDPTHANFVNRCFTMVRDATKLKTKFKTVPQAELHDRLVDYFNGLCRKRKAPDPEDTAAVARANKARTARDQLNRCLAGVAEFLILHWAPSHLDTQQCKRKGYAGIMQQLADQVRVNNANHLWIHTEKRAVRLLRHSLQNVKAEDRGAVYTSWRSGSDMKAPELQPFNGLVRRHREVLGVATSDRITDEWLQAHPTHVLKYQGWILRQLEALAARKQALSEDEAKRVPSTRLFSLLPIRGYRRCHVPIPTSRVHELAGLPRASPTHDIWKRVITPRFWKRGTYNLHSITTDGVQVSLIYSKTVPAQPMRQRASVVVGNRQRGLYTDVELKVEGQSFKRDIIGVDPGSGKDVLVFSNGHRLTKAHYYNECGFNDQKRRQDKRLAHYQETISAAGQQSFKTANWELFLAQWQDRRALLPALFRVYGGKDWSNDKFRAYRYKQRFFHRFFQRRVLKQVPETAIIAFGNGKFPTSLKGKRAAPRTNLCQTLSKLRFTVRTDEFRSSACCGQCDWFMNHPLAYRRHEGSSSQVLEQSWGLLQCSNTECQAICDRNKMAAKTIGRLLKEKLVAGEVRSAFRRSTKRSDLLTQWGLRCQRAIALTTDFRPVPVATSDTAWGSYPTYLSD